MIGLVVGSTIGVLIQLELVSKNAFLPEGAIGGHVTAQVVGYLVLIGMAISATVAGNESLNVQITAGEAIVYGATVDNLTNDSSAGIAQRQ